MRGKPPGMNRRSTRRSNSVVTSQQAMRPIALLLLSFFSPDLGGFYLAVPPQGANSAEIRIFEMTK